MNYPGETTQFQNEPLPETLAHRVRGRDLRAVLLAAKSWEETPAELEARLMLGSAPEAVAARLAAARGVLDRGFGEIAGWFRDQGPEWVLAYQA